jgi:hypothetical protein
MPISRATLATMGAAAHACGDESHVRADEVIADFLHHLLGRGPADLGMGAGAEALRHHEARLDHAFGLGHQKRLRIRVHDDELDPLEAALDHVVDRVATGATDAEHGDPGLQFPDVRGFEIDRHRLGLIFCASRRNACSSLSSRSGPCPPRPQKLSLIQRPTRAK